MLESGWLGLVKLSAWRLAAVSCALWAIWWFVKVGLLPPFHSTWIIYGVPSTALLTGMLAIFAVLERLVKSAQAILRQRTERDAVLRNYERQKQEFRDYVPYATDIEKAILGYLVSKSQKTFTVTIDGGSANTLVSRGFIDRMIIPGQSVSALAVPHQVAPAVWEVLENEMKDSVPTDFYKQFKRPPWHDQMF